MTKMTLDKKTPTESARLWRKAHPHLIRTDKEFLYWDKKCNCYTVVEDETVTASVHLFLDTAMREVPIFRKGKTDPEMTIKPFDPKAHDVTEVVTAVRNLAHRPSGQYAPPCWLDGADKHPDHAPDDIVAVRNGLLHLPTMTLLDKTPNFFNRSAVAIDYAQDAPVPERWLAFVNEVMDGRERLVQSLHESMGYTISGYRDMQKIFFGSGPPRGGKGTTARIMQDLCGPENCASPTMELLNEKYGLETSSGSTLSVVTDATCSGVLTQAANNLKAVSGGDRVDVRRLGIATVKSSKIKTQFWIYFNSENYPNFGGSAAAICARAVAIPFDVSFVGREDYDLYKSLVPELPGILNVCLAAYAGLRERGKFLETPEGEKIKATIMRTGDVFGSCLRDHFEFVSGVRVEQSVALRIFTDYMRDSGGHITASMLTRRLQKMGVTQGRPYVGDDGNRRQAPVYIGLRLNDAAARAAYQWDDMLDEAMLDRGGMPLAREMTDSERAAADAEAASDFGAGDDDDRPSLH